MKVCIAGGSGFIGSFLKNYLEERGFSVVIIGRKDLFAERLTQLLPDTEVLINLMGEAINGRWSKRKKREILVSRVYATDFLVDFIQKHDTKIKLFINASAVGMYANGGHHTEFEYELGDTFLSEVATQWEAAVRPAEGFIEKVVRLRLGVVLGRNAPVLVPFQLARVFRLGVFLNSEVAMPIIHLIDVCRAIEFVMQKGIQGPVNAVLPNLSGIGEFFNIAYDLMHVKFRMGVPTYFVRLMLGKRADLFLNGPNVIPEVLVKNGFDFLFPDAKAVLIDLLLDEN